MNLTRRDFLELLSVVGVGIATDPISAVAKVNKLTYDDLMSFRPVGKASIVFTTDTHGHMKPLYFREPANLVGPKNLAGTPGFIAGYEFLKFYGLKPDTLDCYFDTNVHFIELAHKYGIMGGVSHIARIIKDIVHERGRENTLILDNGDTLATSAITLFTKGKSMLDWMNLVGYDLLVGHWDFTLGKEEFLKRIKEFKGEFISQNIQDEFGELPFKPYVVKEIGGVKIGIVGNSFPYTPISNPAKFVEGWTFGINMDSMQKYVNELRDKHKVDVVILQSHDGLPLDIALTKYVHGIDIIISGHTHDITPKVLRYNNTYIVVAGSHGKFVGRIDLKASKGKLQDISFKLIPVATNIIKPDEDSEKLLKEVFAPYEEKLNTKIGTTSSLIYKRDTFYSTFDELANDAIMDYYHGIDIVFSPGYRWGATLLPGQDITINDVYDFTAITYPNVYVFKLKGSQIRSLLEDMADNVFNPNPIYQQGGDMPRLSKNVYYEIKINEPEGKRFQVIKINGKDLEPNKEYVAATYGGELYKIGTLVQDAKPIPAYELLINYIKSKKHIEINTNPRNLFKVLDEPYNYTTT